MLSTEPSEKWYYDACTLDSRLETFYEIINKGHKSITSHLAIGEGYANCLLKGNRAYSYEVLDSFIELIKKLKTKGLLEIVGHDEVGPILEKVKDIVPRLSVTDSLHLATALHEQCCIFRTIDKDFDGITKPISEKLAYESGMARFAVSPMNSKSRDELFHGKKLTHRNKM